MHFAAAFSSYMPLPKQAADKVTAGLVTKLIGIWPATSRSLYFNAGVSYPVSKGQRAAYQQDSHPGSVEDGSLGVIADRHGENPKKSSRMKGIATALSRVVVSSHH